MRAGEATVKCLLWADQLAAASLLSAVVTTQAGAMADNEKVPLFTRQMRQQLAHRRVVVLDGPLDDDNGTLLTTQFLTLAAEDPVAAL